MMSPEAEAHAALLRDRRDNPPEPDPDVDPMVAARQVDQVFASWSTDPGATITEVDAGGVRALWVDPAPGDPTPVDVDAVLLYLHGGAYVLGTADHVTNMVGHIATRARCRALSVDYRLAPEHGYPAPVDDVLAAYAWLLAQGFSSDKIVLAGDSAGGGLTLAALFAIRDRGIAMPAGAMPLSPWADLSCGLSTWTSAADTDMLLQQDRLAAMAQFYAQGAASDDPLLSPIHGDYAGLPPMLIQSAGHETLLDDALAVAGLAARAGVEVQLDVTPEMQHVFQYCVGKMPEADAAIDRLAAWLRARTS